MNNNISTPTPKPPYALAVACLIPMIGFFIGLTVMIIGLTRYKNKWYVRFGIMGMVFTVLIYGSLFLLTLTHTDKTGLEPSVKESLNELVKVVEFSKMQHGAYPDSLQHAATGSLQLLAWDPMELKFLDRKSSYFRYEKIGDHYLLFSVGADGIPNTKDDLYPQIPVMANGYQFGWIKRK